MMDEKILKIQHTLKKELDENRYHHTVQTGQANPAIMYRMRRLRTDDLPLGKDILPSGSGRKTQRGILRIDP